MRPKIRTIKEAYGEILEEDPNTALTLWGLRQMVINNNLPCIKCGKKYLLNMDTLKEYLKGNIEDKQHLQNNIRCISVR